MKRSRQSYVWAKIPEAMRIWGRWEFGQTVLLFGSEGLRSPGIGLAIMPIPHVGSLK
ncbi:hypothetical protein GMW71_00010 [Pectobacterium brasiliense]|nr:hypothetical protein GMW71_00010 [Pectobacterium brasiliense]